MKKTLFCLSITIASQVAFAQNVGIGTSSPSSKLHLVGNFLQEAGTITLNNPGSIIQFQNATANKSFVQLSGDNLRLGTNSGNQFGKTIIRMAGQDRVLIDSTGNTQILGLQDASLTSDGYITLGSITGRNMILDNNEIIVRDNGGIDNLILQNNGGNVGIGIGDPTATLHVNGDLKITDGTEGSGRVLTSDASGNASWRTTAYSNNDRIMVKFTGFGVDSLMDGTTTLYDNGSMNFSLFNTRFSVIKSGLYHFEGTLLTTAPFGPDPYYMLRPKIHLSLNGGPLIKLASFTKIYSQAELNYFNLFGGGVEEVLPFKIDIYLDAGDYVLFKFSDFLSSLGAQTNAPGYISAYLISE